MGKTPVALIIMDGYGINKDTYGNAIAAAKKPNLDRYFAEWPNTIIGASGMDVGLPDGQMGNSEVGHTNMGAGRIVYQELTRITKSIADGEYLNNEAFCAAVENCKQHGGALHLMGLLSPGGVHSHMEHLYGLLEMAKRNGLEKVYVHAFLDGRDEPPSSAAEFMSETCDKIKEIGVGSVATISGRFYAMDRDNAWDRVEKAYNAMVLGDGVDANGKCPVQAIKDSYANEVTDEFMLPTVTDKNGMIKENDSVIFFNFRPDRARQITRAFVDPEFKGFERKNGFFPVNFVCMAQYDAAMPNVSVAFPPEALKMTLGEYLSKLGKTQLRIAETQKYAHVTFFFNGGEEKQFDGEDRILIKSPDVETFDMKPEMSAYEVTDAVVDAINSDKYDVIILNYANCDMVGHTGIFDAAKAAVEAVKVVKSGDRLEYGWCVTTPVALDEALAKRMPDLENIQIHGGIVMRPLAITQIENPADHFTWNSWHMGGLERKWINEGFSFYAPIRYSELPSYYRDCLPGTDVVMMQVAPMDAHGYFNFGPSASHTAAMLEKAKCVIVEVNENMPRCLGGFEEGIHISKVDMIVEGNNPAIDELGGGGAATEVDQAVARLIVDQIPDGACLQLGIGGMPNAVGSLIAESDLKDLGVHTEM